MNKIFEKEVECSSEYVLSDYMGDVKRVLMSRARAIPTSRFINDNEAEFSGVVEFEIFCSDVEGKLTAVKTSADYELTIPMEDGLEDAVCEPCISNLSVRLTGPRKISARASVSSDIYVSGAGIDMPGGGVFDEGREPEKIIKSVNMENFAYAVSGSRELSDEIALVEGAEYDGLEILFTSGSVKIIEAAPVEGAVLVKGELTVTSIVRNDSDAPFAIRKTIPFEERLTMEKITEETKTVATAYVSAASSAVNTTEDKCCVGVSATVEVFVIAASNEEREIITDAYLPEFDVASTYEDFNYSELVSSAMTTESVSIEMPRTGEIENIRDILASTFEVRALEKKACDNGFELSGEILLTMVGVELSDEGEPTYIQIKNNSPFSINVNTSVGISEHMRLECRALPLEVDHLIDTDKIVAKCPLSVSYRIYKDHGIRRIAHSDIIGAVGEEKKSSVITVYYPQKGDTLFGIARRFHTTVVKIADDNSLNSECISSSDSSDSLSLVKRLIIK